MPKHKELTVYFHAKNIVGACDDFLKPFSFHIIASLDKVPSVDDEIVVAKVKADHMLQFTLMSDMLDIEPIENSIFDHFDNDVEESLKKLYLGITKSLAGAHVFTQKANASIDEATDDDFAMRTAEEKMKKIQHVTEFIELSENKRILLAESKLRIRVDHTLH